MANLNTPQTLWRSSADPEEETRPTFAETQPVYSRDPLAEFQPIRIDPPPGGSAPGRKPGRRRSRGCGCWLPLLILVLLAVYLIFPVRTNIILLGIDDRDPGQVLGRSDTLILLTLKPIDRYLGMLSIPRDLWVNIPGVGENRINTAHFFAEAAQPGSGPDAVKAVIQENFGVEVQYFIRANFENFKQIIDTLGGVRITLAEPLGGYPAGTHLLDADQALAFVRDRSSGGDDFSRMRQTQVLVRALVLTALAPANIPHWPEMVQVVLAAVETDIPLYSWPRQGVALLLAGPAGIDARLISRDMVSPFTTNAGAQVLAPRWDLIQPMILEMFGD